MSDVEANKISTRLGIIDRLITIKGHEISTLLVMVLQLSKVKAENPEYVSQLSDQIQEFRRLNELYKN